MITGELLPVLNGPDSCYRRLHGAWRPMVITIILFFLISFSFCIFPVQPAVAQGLTLWIHPYLTATELTKRFTPLTTYLGREIGQPVSIRIQESYQDHLDFVGANNADIAYLGPVSYVKIRARYGPIPLLAKLEVNDRPFFHGMIIARADSGLETLGDLKGKRFAFGDPNSTMSHIVPRALLAEAGIQVGDLGGYDFLNSHHNVALAVMGGYFDAGAVKEEVFYEFAPRGIRMLAKSPPVPEHLFVARRDLSPDLIDKIQKALHRVAASADGKAICSSIKGDVTGLVAVNDKDYDSLRRLMEFVGP